MKTSVMVKLDAASTSVFLAGGVSEGGCAIASAKGIFASIDASGHWTITSDLGKMHCVVTDPLNLTQYKP